MELVLVAPDSDANLLPLRYGVLEVLYKTGRKRFRGNRKCHRPRGRTVTEL